jgi:1-acyl-sn-glycerol-3-phosphate acyltransferase
MSSKADPADGRRVNQQPVPRRDHPDPPLAPKISRRLLSLFAGYSRWYLRRHFHSVRVLRERLPSVDDSIPLVVYLHHASWWDPLVALLVARQQFPRRDLYAPIDAQALVQYRFFARLGFFGVEAGTTRGAATFLRQSMAVLQQPGASLWVTPQSRFVDVRERPVRFRAGLGHLACRLDHAVFVPMAFEYVFWEERTPEVLVAWGEPLTHEAGRKMDAAVWTARFEERMQLLLDGLAQAAQRRRTSDWATLIEGRAGIGLVYDGWRLTRAWLRGESFRRQHGRK